MNSCSEEVAAGIDEEVSRIIDECYERARSIISEHMDVLHACAALLIEKEKISRKEFEALFGDQVFEKSEEVKNSEGVAVED